MSMANLHGWVFTLPQDVIVTWDGISDSSPGHVQILSGSTFGSISIANTSTANATITFTFNVSLETDNQHYCLLSGPPNYQFDGAQPLNAIWRSDFYRYTELNFCWRMTKADTVITFPKGMPILFLMNYPINLLQSTDIQFKNAEDDPTLNEDKANYSKQRENFYAESPEWTWGNFYKKGIGPDKKQLVENPFKITLMEPK